MDRGLPEMGKSGATRRRFQIRYGGNSSEAFGEWSFTLVFQHAQLNMYINETMSPVASDGSVEIFVTHVFNYEGSGMWGFFDYYTYADTDFKSFTKLGTGAIPSGIIYCPLFPTADSTSYSIER